MPFWNNIIISMWIKILSTMFIYFGETELFLNITKLNFWSLIKTVSFFSFEIGFPVKLVLIFIKTYLYIIQYLKIIEISFK